MQKHVVPHEGTWIEIPLILFFVGYNAVVPHEGTWIEIMKDIASLLIVESFPTRERGLKYLWTEATAGKYGRSPRGNVD